MEPVAELNQTNTINFCIEIVNWLWTISYIIKCYLINIMYVNKIPMLTTTYNTIINVHMKMHPKVWVVGLASMIGPKSNYNATYCRFQLT
jgi:hypothetical protein